MYINDTNIGFYLFAAIIGLWVGQFVDWINERLQENKKIFSTDIFRQYKIYFKPNYILMIVTSVIYMGLVYKFGVKDKFIENLTLIKHLILTPILLSVFVIDSKKQIIPNRLNLTLFETGLVIAFLYGISNIAITIDMILGMVVGVIMFLILSLIGGLIYGKEAIGLGDVKFVGALGLFFGVTNIIIITIIAFLIGAISGLLLIITKQKKTSEYIAFGPFIVIASIITIFVPFEILLNVLKAIFTLGMYKK